MMNGELLSSINEETEPVNRDVKEELNYYCIYHICLYRRRRRRRRCRCSRRSCTD